MGTFTYAPHLRTKDGEAVALANLSAAAGERLLPIFHLTPKPPAKFSEKVALGWEDRPAALDGTYSFGLTGATTIYTNLFTMMGILGVQIIPCISVATDDRLLSSLGKLIGKYADGLVVKCDIGKLDTAEAWVAGKGWKAADIDLVIYAGDIAAYGDSPAFNKFVSHALTTPSHNLSNWRSVTLSAAAAPKDFSSFALGVNTVPRLDWALWKAVNGKVGVPLHYGDYCCFSPDLTEPPGVAMARATVSVRYTVTDDWLIVKGAPTGGASGKPMTQQYQAHAKRLVSRADFDKLPDCWADEEIRKIAAGSRSSGSRATWAAIAANRHLSVVADQLP